MRRGKCGAENRDGYRFDHVHVCALAPPEVHVQGRHVCECGATWALEVVEREVGP